MVEWCTVFEWCVYLNCCARCLCTVVHCECEWLCTVRMDVYCMSVDVLHIDILVLYSECIYSEFGCEEDTSFRTMQCSAGLLTTLSMILLMECSDNYFS